MDIEEKNKYIDSLDWEGFALAWYRQATTNGVKERIRIWFDNQAIKHTPVSRVKIHIL